MSIADPLPYFAALDEYQRQAEALLHALKAGADDARWCFKWAHPRFRGKSVSDIDAATLDLDDAQLVIARQYGFESWPALVGFTESVNRDRALARFEAAVEAVVSGNVMALRSMLSEHPDLVHARSTRGHHATLLHYVGANGVEGARQKTPQSAIDVATTLLNAGAEVDALADMYEAKCTTMSMLVSSAHPAKAGLQAALAETLLDYGAAFVGPGSNWQSALMTALAFGYLTTAEALVRRGAPVDDVAAAAGLGRLAEAARLLPGSDKHSRHVALALAAQHGHVEVVQLLLDAGEDPNRLNPEGHHSHSAPLHQAVWSNHADVVHLLVERGARLDIQDTIYSGTPLDWAIYAQRTEIAKYLRWQAEANECPAEGCVVNTDLLEYYARRAREYEEIYARPDRQADLDRVRAWLRSELSGHRVLEVACGTGYWTAWVAPVTEGIVATDAGEEVLQLARQKSYPRERVQLVLADAFNLGTVPGKFSAAFAGFFWSHVPLQRIPVFLSSLHERLGPGIRVVLLDNRYVEGSSTPLDRRDEAGNTYQKRLLADGSEHEVLKNFPSPADLRALLGADASELRIVEFEHYWGASYETSGA